MPTLLQINETVNVGSTGRIASQIGDTVIKTGWQSYIAYGREKRSCSSQLIRVGNRWNVLSHVLQTRLLDKHGLASKNATKNFIKSIETIRPDIIHLHNIHGYYLNYELLFDYLATINIPIVWTLHDCWPLTGHCSFFEGVGCEGWRTGCGHCPYLEDYPKSLWVDRSAQNFLQKRRAFTLPENVIIVPVSEWLGNLVRESFLGKYRVHVIHNGIDIDVFKPQSKEINKKYSIEADKAVVLGVASVWHERKGLNDFVELSKDENIQVILVGVTEDITKRLPSNIIAMNRTNNPKELAELYSGADVFVNPTYDDNFPTTNIEALACGTPVVTYRTGGSPEAIDDETGIIVEKGDINGLKDAIANLSQRDRSEMKQACRKRAERLYNKDDRFQDYINLYEELLHEKNSIG